MDKLLDLLPQIISAIFTVCSTVISTIMFIKSLKSEKRVKKDLKQAKSDVQITRAGIVEGFKQAVVTKDLKVSINNQVTKVLDDRLTKMEQRITLSESQRTRMNYWMLRIMSWTAAADKLTVEERAEIAELMALIAEDERIVETSE